MFLIFVPIQTTLYKWDRLKNHNGIARPEARFLLSLITVWGFPISLLWFAFTSSGNVSYWSLVIAGGVLGVADPLLWLSILNYITDSYPNVAGSAIAAFLIPSQLLAAGCVHIGTCVGFFSSVYILLPLSGAPAFRVWLETCLPRGTWDFSAHYSTLCFFHELKLYRYSDV
jgi:hypothetical protein